MIANRNTITCPHCDGRVRTQTSRRLSALVREIYFECVDVDCGHRFVAQLGIVRTLVPSLKPKADVRLPIVDRRANDIIVQPKPAPAAQSVFPPAPPATDRRPPAMVLN
jgi:hypothetical protein